MDVSATMTIAEGDYITHDMANITSHGIATLDITTLKENLIDFSKPAYVEVAMSAGSTGDVDLLGVGGEPNVGTVARATR